MNEQLHRLQWKSVVLSLRVVGLEELLVVCRDRWTNVWGVVYIVQCSSTFTALCIMYQNVDSNIHYVSNAKLSNINTVAFGVSSVTTIANGSWCIIVHLLCNKFNGWYSGAPIGRRWPTLLALLGVWRPFISCLSVAYVRSLFRIDKNPCSSASYFATVNKKHSWSSSGVR